MIGESLLFLFVINLSVWSSIIVAMSFVELTRGVPDVTSSASDAGSTTQYEMQFPVSISVRWAQKA
jgi:hypothetical protein